LFNSQDTEPVNVINGVDDFTTPVNTWNLISRKTFPAITKSNAFSLLFVWSLGF
jgi:hypothetical protein